MLPSISERNEEFANAAPARRRVLIAQDVLAQLKAGTLQAESMVYASPRGETCHVCALGALAVSVMNGGAIGKFASRLRDGLEGHFDRHVLKNIERAFEGWTLPESTGTFETMFSRLPDHDRLRMIMENIIANDGEFVIQQLIDWKPADVEG